MPQIPKYTLPSPSTIVSSPSSPAKALIPDLINTWEREQGAHADKAFTEGAATFGANIATGLALGADKLSEAIGTNPSDNTFFKSSAKSLLEMRQDNHYVPSYDQAKVKEMVSNGHILDAMSEVGFQGTVEEFMKSLPYMIGYSAGNVIGLSAAGMSYAVDNAQAKKELTKDKTPLSFNDVYNAENAINATAQAILDKTGFHGEMSALKTIRNVGARGLLTKAGQMTVAKETIKGTLSEGVTEALQQGLQEGYAREDYTAPLFNKDARDNTLFAGFMGSMVGGTVSNVGAVAPKMKADLGSMYKNQTIKNEAVDAYNKSTDEVKESVSKDNFIKDYVDTKKNEDVMSNYSVQINPETQESSMTGLIDNNVVVMDSTGSVSQVMEDGSIKPIEATDEQKSDIKRKATYQTIKDNYDYLNEDIATQEAIWKDMGLDVNDDDVRTVLGSVQQEHTARANLEQAINDIEGIAPKTMQDIHTALMQEASTASEKKLTRWLSSTSMFGSTPEQRLAKIRAKWKIDNLSKEGEQSLLNLMNKEREYATTRLNTLKSVSGQKVELQSSPVNKANSKKPILAQNNIVYEDKIIANDGKTEIVAKNRGGVIHLSNNNALWASYFNEKRWTKPRKQTDGSYAEPIDANAFSTLDELRDFVVQHELAHNVIKKKDDETIGQYETRVNNRALSVMGKKPNTVSSSKESHLLVSNKTTEHVFDSKKSATPMNVVIASEVTNKGAKAWVDNLVSSMEKSINNFNVMFIGKSSETNSFELDRITDAKGNYKNPLITIADGFRTLKDGKNGTMYFNQEKVATMSILGALSASSQSVFGSTDSSLEVATKLATYKDEGGEFVDQDMLSDVLGFNGFYAEAMVLDLGLDILSSLGFEFKKDMIKSYADKISASVGYMTLESLKDNGYLESQEFGTKRVNEHGKEEGGKFRLYRPTEKLRELNKHMKHLGKTLTAKQRNTLFVVSEDMEVPVDKTIRHTNIPLSKPQTQAVKAHQSKEYVLNKDFFNAVKDYVLNPDGSFNEEHICDIVGEPRTEDVINKTVQIMFRKNAINKRNNAIGYFINSFNVFNSLELDDKFKYKYFVSQSGRSQVDASAGADIQNDKTFSRWAVDWNNNPNNPNSNQYEVNNENVHEYRFAVLQGFEHLHDVADIADKCDKTEKEINLVKFNKIVDFFKGKSDEELIKLALKDGSHALRAMLGFIQGRTKVFKNGKVKGKGFKTDILGENDGITNGLGHNAFQSILAVTEFTDDVKALIDDTFQRVGVFKQKDLTAQQAKNVIEGYLDTYQTTAKKGNELLFEITDIEDKRVQASIEAFKKIIGDTISRSFAKSPTMITMYGAGSKKVEQDVGHEVFVALVDYALKNPSEAKHLAKAISYVNKNGKTVYPLSFINGLTSKDGLNYKMSNKDIFWAEDFLAKGIGSILGQALSKVFNVVNMHNSALYEISAAIRLVVANSERFKHVTNELNANKDLTIQEYNELKAELNQMFPLIETAWSFHGEPSYTMRTHDIQTEKTGKNEVFFKRMDKDGNEVKDSFGFSTHEYDMDRTEYGAEGYSAYSSGDKSRSVSATHNDDGATISMPNMIDKYITQVFDAAVVYVGMMEDMSKTYNEDFFKLNTQYSILLSFVNGLKDTIGIAKKLDLKPQEEDIKRAEEVIDRFENMVIQNTEQLALIASEYNSVGQMSGFDGGVYQVKPDDINAIEEKAMIRKSNKKHGLKLRSESNGIPRSENVLSNDEYDYSKESVLNTFDSLTTERPSNNDVLRSLISSISDKLSKPMKDIAQRLKLSTNDLRTVGEYNKLTRSIHVSMSSNRTDYQSKSAQEVFAHELVHMASEEGFDMNPSLEKEVRKLMEDTKSQIDELGGYEYFMSIAPDGSIDAIRSEAEERKAAQEKYDYIFNNTREFFAYGLTDESVYSLLSKLKPKEKEAKSVVDKLMKIFHLIVDMISTALGNEVISNGTTKERLDLLAIKIFAANARETTSAFKLSNEVNDMFNKADEMISAKISPAIATFVNHTKPLTEASKDLLAKVGKTWVGENNIVRSLKNEIFAGGLTAKNAVIKLMRVKELYEKGYNDRRHILSRMISTKLNATDSEEASIQIALMDTDAQSLGMSPKDIVMLASNVTSLNKKIESMHSDIIKLAKNPKERAYANYIINQANGLGLYLGKGIVGLRNGQMLNAENIVSGKWYSGSIEISPINNKELVSMVDKLASLYALKYTDRNVISKLSQYIIKDGSNEAVEELFALSRENSNKSNELFKYQTHLKVKGYSRTVYDRNTEIETIPFDKVNEHIKKGWKVVAPIMTSNVIIMKRFNPEIKFSEGILDVGRAGRMGTTDTSYYNEDIKESMQDMSRQAEYIYGSLNEIPAGTYTLPLIDRVEIGKINSYRYVANKKLRIEHLGQEFRVSKVQAETMAMTYRKLAGRSNNFNLIVALFKAMKRPDFNKADAVPITEDSEMYRLLPPEVKHKMKSMQKEFGTLYVEKDLLDNVFGYKDASLSHIVQDMPHGSRLVKIAEKITFDIASHVRKNIVFKTAKVIFDNVLSNFISLVWRGMNPITAMKYMDEGRKLMNQYRADSEERLRLVARKEAKLSFDTKRLSFLENQMKNNPIHFLVRSGQFQSIIDDIDTELDSKNNIVERYGDKLRMMLPERIRKFFDIIYINEDTTGYKQLMKFVQYSDFVSKYAYFKHITVDNRAKYKDMTDAQVREIAIDEAEGMFINYSLLQDKHIKYLSDIGGFMFSKYLFRIQRMIARSFHKNPVRGVVTAGMQKALGDVSDISDSFLIGKDLAGRSGVDVVDLMKPHFPEMIGLI